MSEDEKYYVVEKVSVIHGKPNPLRKKILAETRWDAVTEWCEVNSEAIRNEKVVYVHCRAFDYNEDDDRWHTYKVGIHLEPVFDIAATRSGE